MIAYVENSARPETWARDTVLTYAITDYRLIYAGELISVAVCRVVKRRLFIHPEVSVQ